MKKEIQNFFESENIEFYGVLPIEECKVNKEYLLAKEGFVPKSVICFLVPYYTQEGVNISNYAVSRDYHIFVRELSKRLVELLQTLYPNSSTYGFSDHSPIHELYAAAKCGLGVIGENGLIINEKYSSFVFIGDVFTDIDAKELGYIKAEEIRYCKKCNKCKKACPTGALIDYSSPCLSAITQKKGELSEEELSLMVKHNTVWGCDICQIVCPYTKIAKEKGTIYTPIEFFLQEIIPELDLTTLDAMNDETFLTRAYAWRKRETIRRNIVLTEKADAQNEKLQKA